MPYAKTSYVSLVDYSTANVEKLTVTGAIKFCERPSAADPLWLLIATDAGELRVFNEAGVHQPGSDVDLGWNPDQVAINNDDPPKILVRRHSVLSIYLYESGSLSWSVTAITNMAEALISDGWVHTLLSLAGTAASNGAQWRSLTDGSIDQDVRGITAGGTCLADGLSVTESGEAVFYLWRNVIAAAWHFYLRREDRTAGVEYDEIDLNTGGYGCQPFRSRCCADGSLVTLATWHANTNTTYLYLRSGTDGGALYDTSGSGLNIYRLSVNPAGTRAAYLHEDDLHKLTALGAHTTTVMGGDKAANLRCFDITDDPFYICGLENGDIEVYNDALTLKATIEYELSDTPISVVRRTS